MHRLPVLTVRGDLQVIITGARSRLPDELDRYPCSPQRSGSTPPAAPCRNASCLPSAGRPPCRRSGRRQFGGSPARLPVGHPRLRRDEAAFPYGHICPFCPGIFRKQPHHACCPVVRHHIGQIVHIVDVIYQPFRASAPKTVLQKRTRGDGIGHPRGF